MAFPPQFLDELRARIAVSEVIAPKVRLTRRGREWTTVERRPEAAPIALGDGTEERHRDLGRLLCFLGACGDASIMHNSYGVGSTFPTTSLSTMDTSNASSVERKTIP